MRQPLRQDCTGPGGDVGGENVVECRNKAVHDGKKEAKGDKRVTKSRREVEGKSRKVEGGWAQSLAELSWAKVS